jgi:hypothetical protein
MSIQLLPYPTWVPATIQHSRNQDFVLDYLIVDCKWKPLGEKSMAPEDCPMNAREIRKRINIGEK